MFVGIYVSERRHKVSFHSGEKFVRSSLRIHNKEEVKEEKAEKKNKNDDIKTGNGGVVGGNKLVLESIKYTRGSLFVLDQFNCIQTEHLPVENCSNVSLLSKI